VSLIAPWLGFPLLLAAIGLGWGVIVERVAGTQVNDALVIPLGLAAALIVAGTFTAFSGSAPGAAPAVAVGAGAGLLLLAWPRLRGLRARTSDGGGKARPAGGKARPASGKRRPASGKAHPASEKGRRASDRAVAGDAALSDDSHAASGSARARELHRWRLPAGWAALAALGALLAYGAPVLLTGHATFTGYVKLDDTATWFNVVDVVMAHSNSLSALNSAYQPASTFSTVFIGDVGTHYPLGAFMLLGVGHELTGIDPAWIFQPYLACCAAALALGIYALAEPLVRSPRLRALVAFLGAQAALLYGYSLWGAIKEMTAAFLLVLGIALIAPLLRRPPARVRDVRAMVPLAIAAGALIQTVQVGAGVWVAPALLILALAWVLPRPGRRRLRTIVASIGALAAMTAVLIVPVWVSLGSFLSHGLPGLLAEGQTRGEDLGNLLHPLSGWQLAGIWPAGDFRIPAPAFPTVLFIAVVLLAAAVGLWFSVRRRQYGLALYGLLAPLGCFIIWRAGATPWTVGKSLSFTSPALLTAGLVGAAMLCSRERRPPPIAGAAQAGPEAPVRRRARRRPASSRARAFMRGRRPASAWPAAARPILGALALLTIAVGVLWSNALQYSDATLAPRDRLVELEHIGELVKGKGPTLVNEYEVYADRHFLREGAPVEPAEYRPYTVPLRTGAILTKSAWANLDSFSLSTILAYRSIVTRRDPVESRPPSVYRLVWQGRYYQLWQRPQPAPTTILEHIPYGEENTLPYCGNATGGSTKPLCSINPASVPSCPQLLSFARKAAAEHAHLLAYQHGEPDFVRGDEMRWPRAWRHETESHSIQPTTPGWAVGHILVPSSQTYELFLGGSFGRGFEVKVDGRKVGSVANQLTGFISYIPITRLYLTAGEHTFQYTYPQPGLAPASGETLGMSEYWAGVGRWTSLTAVVLQPLDFPRSELISASPAEARKLCGRQLDWLELVAGAA
jgi:hypothetical protein